MLSEKQYEIKKLKIMECIELYLSDDDITQSLISEKTGIPQSSVDRYLKDNEAIKEIYPFNYSEIIEKIAQKSNSNKVKGVVTGGNNFAANNEALKDENGHFIGSKRK